MWIKINTCTSKQSRKRFRWLQCKHGFVIHTCCKRISPFFARPVDFFPVFLALSLSLLLYILYKLIILCSLVRLVSKVLLMVRFNKPVVRSTLELAACLTLLQKLNYLCIDQYYNLGSVKSASEVMFLGSLCLCNHFVLFSNRLIFYTPWISFSFLLHACLPNFDFISVTKCKKWK